MSFRLRNVRKSFKGYCVVYGGFVSGDLVEGFDESIAELAVRVGREPCDWEVKACAVLYLLACGERADEVVASASLLVSSVRLRRGLLSLARAQPAVNFLP